MDLMNRRLQASGRALALTMITATASVAETSASTVLSTSTPSGSSPIAASARSASSVSASASSTSATAAAVPSAPTSASGSASSSLSTDAGGSPPSDDSPSRKRKRDDSSTGEMPSKVQIRALDESADDDGEICSICFEDWSNAGEHRVASLKCGHLFGHSCIKKWLAGTGKKCPQCNEPAKTKDVRVIFCKRLKAIDTAERDRALEDLEEEKKRRLQVEATVADLRVKLEIERTEKERLRRGLEEAQTQLRGALVNAVSSRAANVALSSSSSSFSPTINVGSSTSAFNGSFVLRRKGAVGDGGSRIVEYCRRENVIVASRQQTNPLFPGFGVQMIQPDFSQQRYIPLHTKAIKCFSISARSHLLSVGHDKQIKITSLMSGNPVSSYNSARAAWSCTWDSDNDFVFYVGLDGGLIHAYDTRLVNCPNSTDNYVKSLPSLSFAPVISINHVSSPAPSTSSSASCASSTSSSHLKGLLVGHMDGKCIFYEEKPSDPSQQRQPLESQRSLQLRDDGPQALRWEPHVLPLEGTLVSLTFEQESHEFLATFRPNSKYSRVRHVFGRLGRVDQQSTSITCLGIKVIEGGSTLSTISKSALIPRPLSSSLVCAGDEESNSAFLWDTVTGSRVQRLHAGTAVVDVCHFPARGARGPALALLSDKALAVYDYRQTS